MVLVFLLMIFVTFGSQSMVSVTLGGLPVAHFWNFPSMRTEGHFSPERQGVRRARGGAWLHDNHPARKRTIPKHLIWDQWLKIAVLNIVIRYVTCSEPISPRKGLWRDVRLFRPGLHPSHKTAFYDESSRFLAALKPSHHCVFSAS